MVELSSLFSVGEAVDDILREGPLTQDELIEALEDRGLRLGDDPMGHVFDAMSDTIEMIGDRMISLDWMVETLRCAVDVAADAEGIVCTGALELLTVASDGFELVPADDADTDGAADGDLGWIEVDAAERLDEVDVLVGPPGWLSPVLGRRAVITLDHGSLSIAVDERESSRDEWLAAAFRDAYEACRADRPGGPDLMQEQYGDSELADDLGTVATARVLFRMVVDAHDELSRRIIPPIDELVADAGLELHGATVAPAGTDWELVEIRQRVRRYMTMHGLDAEQAERLNLALGAAWQFLDDGVIAADPTERPGASALVSILLNDAEVGRAFLSEWNEYGYDDRDLVSFVMTVMGDLGDHDPSGLVFLAASAFDSLGMVPEAIEALDRLMPHTDHPGVFVMRAGFAADAGDAMLAARLLRQAGTSSTDDDEDELGDSRSGMLWREIGLFLARPPAVAKRNDPCPCGSGRKYKACHQGSEQHPLDKRAAWLHRKALRYVDTHARAEHSEHVAAATQASGGGYRMLRVLLGSDLIGDVTLHEGGVWADFLAERGPLLPQDEQLLAAQWALVDRSVYEVVSTHGFEAQLRDLRTGDRITLPDVTTDRMSPGGLVIGRLLPVGDTYRAFAGLAPLGAARRDAAMEALDRGDDMEIAALLGSTLQPPQMSNTDGQPLRFHSLTWLVEDVDSAADTLRTAGWKVHGDEVSLVRDSTNQRDTVIASGTLGGRRLSLEVNSDARADELMLMLRRLLPESLVLDHDVREFHEVMASGGPRPPGGPASEPQLSPEQQREIMTEFMAMAEQRWVDEPVPALRGMTPRDAAADPIGRIELERLLDSFPDTDDPGQMSPRRLRSLLGL